MPKSTTITSTIRRRFILGKQGLWPGRRWAGKEGVAAALRAAEAVQIDPVVVLAPSHDIVLWGRVQGYRPDHLDELIYTERRFFDYGGGLMIYPIEELPYWRVYMERRKSGTRWVDFQRANPDLVDLVRQELRSRGPLRSRDLDGHSVIHYRSSKDTGVVLYYLWLTGELMIHSRQGKERVYDFLEKIAPPHLHGSVSEADAIQYFTRKEIAQRGLVSPRDFRSILRAVTEELVDPQEANRHLNEMVDAGQLVRLGLEDHKEPVYLLASDLPLLDDLVSDKIPSAWQPLSATTLDEVTFLSPLEYTTARGRAKELFGFQYTWEIYKPATTRLYGPYTLPVLYGDRLVARMDARLDRPRRSLIVNGFWLEADFSPDAPFKAALTQGLRSFIGFLGADRIEAGHLPLEQTWFNDLSVSA